MRGHVRLVQRGRVQHGLDAGHAAAHERPVDDGTDVMRERRGVEVDADRLVPRAGQRAHERFAEMPRAPRDQYSHPKAKSNRRYFWQTGQ
jgi:hypothetical protein